MFGRTFITFVRFWTFGFTIFPCVVMDGVDMASNSIMCYYFVVVVTPSLKKIERMM